MKKLFLIIVLLVSVSPLFCLDKGSLNYSNTEYKYEYVISVMGETITLSYICTYDRSEKNANLYFVTSPKIDVSNPEILENNEILNTAFSGIKGTTIVIPYNVKTRKLDIEHITDVSDIVIENTPLEKLENNSESIKMLGTFITSIYTSIIYNIVLPDLTTDALNIPANQNDIWIDSGDKTMKVKTRIIDKKYLVFREVTINSKGSDIKITLSIIE